MEADSFLRLYRTHPGARLCNWGWGSDPPGPPCLHTKVLCLPSTIPDPERPSQGDPSGSHDGDAGELGWRPGWETRTEARPFSRHGDPDGRGRAHVVRGEVPNERKEVGEGMRPRRTEGN